MTAERTLDIVNLRGLHARAAAKFVRTAEKHRASVTVSKDGLRVCGTSIMGLLMLGAAQNTSIRVFAEGEDAEAALEDLARLVAERFGEDA